MISAAIQGWFNYNALILMITGNLNITLDITVAGKTLELRRKLNYWPEIFDKVSDTDVQIPVGRYCLSQFGHSTDG